MEIDKSHARVRRALDEMRAGKMVILVDDEDRENEGDLCLAANKVTPEAINFMATYGRGLICLALDDAQIERLRLPMMVQDNQASLGTAFTVSIEARDGVSTGISARDRAHTIATAIREDAQPSELVSPGHVFPLRARPGGVLVRTGQTEGSVDLARLADLGPSAVICEIMRDDGEMARMPDLEEFAAKHEIMILSVADLVAYRLRKEAIVESKQSFTLRPGVLPPGENFQGHVYETSVEDTEYFALVRGDVRAAAARGESVLVRVQSLCPAADTFQFRRDLTNCLSAIDRAGVGVFLYVYNRGRSSLRGGLDRIFGPADRARSRDKTPTDTSRVLRDFGLGAQVLADLGCRNVRLMSNSDRKIVGIEGFGIEVVERVPIPGDAGNDDGVHFQTFAGGKSEGSQKGEV